MEIALQYIGYNFLAFTIVFILDIVQDIDELGVKRDHSILDTLLGIWMWVTIISVIVATVHYLVLTITEVTRCISALLA